ncbi:MAG: pyridoxamine 5'-phosphate oxidase family protein [Thaumarchaeota archaeon]|nr:pyridoxamine 5'-phosphate oxidase family protein [Nitrososphaerota archaeon]
MAAREKQSEIPGKVMDLLKTSRIGYLSVKSEKGDLYAYPVAFYFAGMQVYFMTPTSAAKLRFMRANPDVSFLVDNRDLTLGASGVMMQGRVKIFSIAKTVASILSVGPKMAKFSRKYPGMFTFYAKGRGLPDERKLYKYRLIRIEPTKVLYWLGYKFGRYSTAKGEKDDALARSSDEEKMEAFATLLRGADEEFPAGKAPALGDEWESEVDAAVEKGIISEEEHRAISSFRDFLRQAVEENKLGPQVTAGEKLLLKKWKKSSSVDA